MKDYLRQIDAVAAAGPFKPEWDSLREYVVPQWYRDAKLGIFIHWGAYSVPGFWHEWYPREMYLKESAAYQFHREVYGDQKSFGYKDIIPHFKGEKWDPVAWADLFREAGARYVVPVGEHHDGFSMFKTDLCRWNAAEMGPKRDVAQELAEAVRARGMTFGISNHRAEHWWFFEGGRQHECDVQDDAYRDLYGPAMPQSTEPDEAFLQDWLGRSCEMVDKFRPSVYYFDWWIERPVFEPYLRKFAAYYYNRGAEWNLPVAINYKHNSMPEGSAVYDIERSLLKAIHPMPWQTCTTVANTSWGYIKGQQYKKAGTILHDFIDIVSKNGCLLLNVGPRPDGTIPEPEQAMLREIGRWLKRNAEAIYGTRPWRVYGEGPTDVPQGDFTDSKRAPFTAGDMRFTAKDDIVYAILLAWPEEGAVEVKALGRNSTFLDRPIEKVDLIGNEAPLEWKQHGGALRVILPKEKVGEHAWVLRVGI